MLSAKKWQIRSSVLTAPNTPTVDVYAIAQPCTLDNFIQYAAPNTFIYDEGLTKCQAIDAQQRLGIWALGSNDTQLTVSFNGFTTIYTIDEVTDTSLKLTSGLTL